jgi:hypothetical protein
VVRLKIETAIANARLNPDLAFTHKDFAECAKFFAWSIDMDGRLEQHMIRDGIVLEETWSGTAGMFIESSNQFLSDGWIFVRLHKLFRG